MLGLSDILSQQFKKLLLKLQRIHAHIVGAAAPPSVQRHSPAMSSSGDEDADNNQDHNSNEDGVVQQARPSLLSVETEVVGHHSPPF